MSIFHLLYTYSRYNLKNIYFESGELFGLNLISLYLKTHASPLPRKKICCKKKNLRLQHFFIWFLRLVICLSVFMNIFVCDVVLIIKWICWKSKITFIFILLGWQNKYKYIYSSTLTNLNRDRPIFYTISIKMGKGDKDFTNTTRESLQYLVNIYLFKQNLI